MTADSRDLGIMLSEIQLGITRTIMHACHSSKVKVRLYLNYLPLFDRGFVFCLYRIISLVDLLYSSLYNKICRQSTICGLYSSRPASI